MDFSFFVGKDYTGGYPVIKLYNVTKDADGNDKINMLEINTTPGMTATSFIPQQVRAAGLDIKDVLTDIVENQF